MLETRERSKISVPLVTYSPEVENSPYLVRINPEECARALRTLNVREIDISLLRINVVPKPSLHMRIVLGNLAGAYKPGDREINLFAENHWKRYSIWLDIVRGVIKGKYKPREGMFRDELYTEKLVDYLTSAPPERAFQNAENLLRKSCDRWFRWTILHELRHVGQSPNPFSRSIQNYNEKENECAHFSGDFDADFRNIASLEPKEIPVL